MDATIVALIEEACNNCNASADISVLGVMCHAISVNVRFLRSPCTVLRPLCKLIMRSLQNNGINSCI